MYNIAILIPLCSRNQNYNELNKTPFINKFLPNFENTKETEFTYKIFIGVDNDDDYYLEHQKELEQVVYKYLVLDGCQNSPAFAWNKLALEAYNDENINFDYFFQIGDDVEIASKNWTSRFVSKLQKHNNIGVVGPTNLTNYNQRMDLKMKYVIENSFVHRTHLDIFNTFFNKEIRNWYCDDWITSIYRPFYCEIQKDIICFNTIRDSRYKVLGVENLPVYIKSGQISINNYKQNENIVVEITHTEEIQVKGKNIFSYCLYGDNKKYCLGMLKNIEQIKKHFPEFGIYIHIGNDVPNMYVEQYQKYKNVKLIKYDFTGIILMTYRFFSYDDDDIKMMLLRDADSRFNERDLWIINDFIKSDKNMFTIRDHPFHTAKIMGGQSGFRNIKLNLQSVYEREWKLSNANASYWYDQKFLEFSVYKRFVDELVVYTNIRNLVYENEKRNPITIQQKDGYDFCGNVVLFDANNVESYQFKLY